MRITSMINYDKSLLDTPEHKMISLGEMEENQDIQLVVVSPQKIMKCHEQKIIIHPDREQEQQANFSKPHPQSLHQDKQFNEDAVHHEYNCYIHDYPTDCDNNDDNNKNSRSRRGCCSRVARWCKGSIYLAFLSHISFIIASLFYIKLSFVQRDWIQYTMVENDLTTEILNTDDDVSWSEWANENQGEYREPPTYLQLTRLTYGDDYTLWCTRGACFFALVGALDWLRYCDNLNIFMILAGLAGVISGNSKSTRAAAVWDAISVHLFFLESITLLKRVHYYPNEVNANASVTSNSSAKKKDNGIVDVGDHYVESSPSGDVDGLNGICSSRTMDNGIRDATTYIDENNDDDAYPFFRVGDLFFFLGSMLDIVGSYISLAGMVGMWIAYTDVVACFLWLGCALVAIFAEIYYLQKQIAALIESNDEHEWGCLHCY